MGKLVNLILYSNFWIASAALAMCAKTVGALGHNPLLAYPFYAFVFFAALFVYAAHRVVGLRKARPFMAQGRYKVIADYQWHIFGYAGIGASGTLFFSFFLEWKTWWVMVLPGLLSLGYVLPLFAGAEKKRLRDFDDIKIYLVALVWTTVSVLLPYVELGASDWHFLVWSSIEVFCFVFAITLPFDIRDLEVDGHLAVRTIPARYGVAVAKKTALGLLALSFFSASVLWWHSYGEIPLALGLWTLAVYGLTAMLIRHSKAGKSDYYYTGWLDGTMILLGLGGIIAG